MDWFQKGKGVRQGCVLSPYLFNLFAQYIMRNAGLEEAQAGIKIGGRNVNNLRYADDTTLMTESEQELLRRGWQNMRWLDGITDWKTWVWASSGDWWWIGKPDMLQSMDSQRVRHDWVTHLNWILRGRQIKMINFHNILEDYKYNRKKDKAY